MRAHMHIGFRFAAAVLGVAIADPALIVGKWRNPAARHLWYVAAAAGARLSPGLPSAAGARRSTPPLKGR